MERTYTLRQVVTVVLFLLLLNGASGAIAQDIQLSTVPALVYKIQDSSKQNTETWLFNLVVSDRNNRQAIRPIEAKLQLFSGQSLLETHVLPAATLERMRRTSYLITKEVPTHSIRHKYSREELFDLRLEFPQKPTEWDINRVHVSLRLSLPGVKETTISIDVPISRYTQRTALTFPFKGTAIVTQGQMNNGGHSAYSNQFAIDVMALTPTYAPMVSGGNGNSAFASWGKELIAPADGTVLYARNDVPDNAPGVDPEEIFPKLPDPVLATAGNAVVIDHGNSEYSVLMHMQKGSVQVVKGQRIRRGEPIGRIGNSGDSFGPHLHFQLQSGPELFRDPSVPVVFENVKGLLARGVYFETK